MAIPRPRTESTCLQEQGTSSGAGAGTTGAGKLGDGAAKGQRHHTPDDAMKVTCALAAVTRGQRPLHRPHDDDDSRDVFAPLDGASDDDIGGCSQ